MALETTHFTGHPCSDANTGSREDSRTLRPDIATPASANFTRRKELITLYYEVSE